jgi:hypothetical protein
MKKILPAALAMLTVLSIFVPQSQAATSSFPKCNESIQSLPVPDAPHGLFVLLFPGQRRLIEEKKDVLVHNPALCGAEVYVVWSEVDKGVGNYNWDIVERQMEPWVKAGKMINFIVWAIGYGQASSRAIPPQILSKLPTTTCRAYGTVPIFWSREFMSAYQQFMSAFVQKFGSNPSVGYIRFGLGAGGESYPACMFELMRRGEYSDDKWRKYLFDMMDYEKSLGSSKQIMVSLIGQKPEVSRDIAEHAVKLGFGFGIQSLDADAMQKHRSGGTCNGDWCKLFEKYQGKVPLELQTFAKSEPGGGGETGSLSDLLPFGLQMHAQIFELYPQDWLIAYDRDDPNNKRAGAEYQKALEDAAKVVGGSPR